jgi:hypothetical protein
MEWNLSDQLDSSNFIYIYNLIISLDLGGMAPLRLHMASLMSNAIFDVAIQLYQGGHAHFMLLSMLFNLWYTVTFNFLGSLRGLLLFL